MDITGYLGAIDEPNRHLAPWETHIGMIPAGVPINMPGAIIGSGANDALYIGFTEENVCVQQAVRQKINQLKDKIHSAFKANPHIWNNAALPEGRIFGSNTQNSSVGEGSILEVRGNGTALNAKIGRNSRVHIMDDTEANDIIVGDNVFIYNRKLISSDCVYEQFCLIHHNLSPLHGFESDIKESLYLKMHELQISNYDRAYILLQGYKDHASALSGLHIELIGIIAMSILKFSYAGDDLCLCYGDNESLGIFKEEYNAWLSSW
jgi:hypothetical protein